MAWLYPTGVTRLSPNGQFGARRLQTPGVPHNGVDFPVPTGTPVHATAAGTVKRVYTQVLGGKIVLIDHGAGVESEYAHLSAQLVRAGQTVTAGQHIANSGATGVSVGAHLHFGIRVNGAWVDPMRYLAGAGAPGATSPAADQSAWVTRLARIFAAVEGQPWQAVLDGWEETKLFQLPALARPEYMNFGFTEESWRELRAVVGALGLSSKPISRSDYPAIAARMTTPASSSSGPITVAVDWPDLWGPAANVAVAGAGILLVYRGLITILRP